MKTALKDKFNLSSSIAGSAKEYSFEEIVFNASALIISLIAFALAVTTLFLELHPVHHFAIYLLGIFSLSLFCLSKFRHKTYPVLLVLSLCVFLSVLWFTGVGSNGFAGLFFIAGVVLSVTILDGTKRYLLVLINLLCVILLVGIEWFHPEWVGTYTTPAAKYIDYLLNILCLMIGLGFYIKILVDRLHERTEQLEKSNEQLKHSSLYDELTGIPNRRLLYAQLDNIIDLARRNNKKFTLLYLDLDDFKTVNDEWGHATGDVVLREVARAMKGCLRKSDILARMGGDEFSVLLPETQEKKNIETIVEKIFGTIEPGFLIYDQPVYVGVSIGASIFEADNTSAERLIMQADEAMYQAKRYGGNMCVFHGENEQNNGKAWGVRVKTVLSS